MTRPNILMIGGAASRLCLAGGLARDLGADIRFMDNAADGVAMVLSDACDLVLIEMGLRVADFVRRLREEGCSTPVLACGVAVPPEDAVAAVRAGARDYVALPPSREAILAVLASTQATVSGSGAHVDALVGQTMTMVEQALIIETLQRCNGNRTAASHLLGISVRTMRNKLRAFNDAGVAVPPAA